MVTLFRKLEKCFALGWAVVILVASVMPVDDIRVESNMLFPHADKFVHFLMYFILQSLLLRQFNENENNKKQMILFILVASYGIILELVQGYFLVDRSFENYDIIANITGALIGLLFFNRIKS